MELSRSGLNLRGFELRWYALLIVFGMALAMMLCARREKRFGLPNETWLDLALFAIPLGVICARAYYVIFAWESFAGRPLEIFNLRGGGLAIPGGILGGALGVWLCARIKKFSFRRAADLIAPGLALAQAVGRWGNFLNREAYGAVVENLALGFFPLSVEIDGSMRYATFFYEFLWCALIALAILLLERRGFFRRDGDGFCCYLLLYSVERAMVEGLRADSLMRGNVRVTQLLCVIIAAAVTACNLLRRGKARFAAKLIPIVCFIVWTYLLLTAPAVYELIPAALLVASLAIIYVGTERKRI